MTPQRTRALTPARIVGLALIALVAAGLAYLRFAPDSGAVSVPAGAHAGRLVLHPCDYGTEDGSYAADCGTLVVRENRAEPHSRLIAVPVTRIRARSGRSAEPIFRLEGGPGLTNMDFSKASRFAGHRDVVLVGYRGVDGSVRLDCPEVESTLKRSTDFLAESSLERYGDAFRRCARRLTDDGVDLAGYGLVDQVDDLEAARRALGYGRIDLLSESAGTRTAMVYAWRYPRHVRRSVMIGVNPPGHFVWDARTTDEQVRRYAAACAHDGGCRARTDDLAATVRDTPVPRRWFFLPIERGNVRVATFYGLVETTSEAAPISAPMTLGSWLAGAEGDGSGFWFQSLLARFAFPETFVWGQMAAFGRVDAAAAERYFSSRRAGRPSILGDPGTRFLWGGGRLARAWPAARGENEYGRVRPSGVETLLIGGELDFATPPQAATNELLPHLSRGHQVVLPGLGHSTSFWTQQPRAGTHLIETFFDSGRVDRSLYRPQRVDFTPEVTQTALGKGFAGGMAGLALLTVVSLLWTAHRVRVRGRLGRTAGALVRSLYALVLGLGGWLLGLLVVTTSMPSVPLDDELLAALSIGLPVGLAVHLAWVDRDWSSRTKWTGFAAALAGALVGAWLGFGAADGLLAVVTTIAGATAGANLTLIALDAAWDAQRRDRFAAGSAPGDASEVRASTG